MKRSTRSNRANSTRRSCFNPEPISRLEPRLMMAANPVISEFMASNSTTLADGNGNYGDWIEIQDTGDVSIDMVGWHLSDDATNPAKWTFPDTTIAAGGTLVVFADGTNTTDPSGYFHTNFSLSAGGETLELTRPDSSVASSWNPDGTAYPAQSTDVSYGTGTIYHNTTLIAPGATASYYIPKTAASDVATTTWTAVNYNSSSWSAGPTGLGYDTGGYEDNSVSPTLAGDWSADDLTTATYGSLTSGSKVTSWSDEVKRAPATSKSTAASPTLVTNDINGHAGVRFNASNVTQLRVAAANNPMSAAGDFTVAVVLKTTTGTASRSEWYNNAGLVDGEESGTANDWGLAVTSTGYLGAGLGNPDTTAYSKVANGSTTSVTNGAAHVAVYTREGGSITLYVDGGNGITLAASGADRDVEDMVFGSLQSNLDYYTGDIAEVQIFNGAETTAAKAYAVAQPLATKYGVTLTAATASITPTLTGDWLGDSLTSLGNNGAVTSWTSTANSTTRAATASSASIAPSVMTNQLNGHSVVHFNGANNDQLRVTSSVNPMAGVGNFTVAVVFRTSTPGVGQADYWYNNTGIVDAEQGGVTDDWGIAINSGGQVAAGLGNPDESTYSGGLLDDGNPHVIVYSRNGAVTDEYIDGSSIPIESTEGGTDNRNVADVVFGSIQTGFNYFTGDIAEVQVYGGAVTGDLAGSIGHTLDSKYGVVSAPSAYAPYISTNLQTAMYGSATTADIRIPFTVPGAVSQYTKLQLTMQYDDGFVAYINGTEVLRENAPTGTINYQSIAPSVRPKAQAIAPQTIDLSAFLPLLNGNGATNVLSIKVLNTSLTDPDLLVVPQLVISTTTTGPAYFTTPTPNAPNGQGYVGFVSMPTVSTPHGYYSTTFTTTISDATPGATIYYTTDGSDPSPTNGIAIKPTSPTATPSGGVVISASTPLRAAAFLDAYIPSGITTVSYIFVSSVLTQTNTAPSGAYWSTAVNPAIVNLAQTYNVSQALLSIPSVSLVLPFADMFGPLGIYYNPTEKGPDWEKATSVEYFDPNNLTAGFTIDAGIRIQGGADRGGGDPKKSFRLFFSSQYGASKLTYPIFGTANPQQSFDHVLLKAIHNYSWANGGGTDPTQGDLVRDQFARDLQAQITGHSATTKWVQLYIDGQYWGLYAMTEEPDATWAAANFGGTKDDYEVLQPDGSGGVEVLSGTGTAYQNLFTTIASDYSDGSISTAEYTALQPQLDMKGLVDYMLTIFYRGDQDAPVLIGSTTSPRNFYAFRDATTGGPFEFTTWDGELGLSDVNFNRTTIGGDLSPGTLFQDLKTNPDFAQLVADETYRLFYNNGALESDSTVDNPKTTYDNDAAQINIAIVGESARWGETQTSTPLTRDGDWIPEINNLNTNYFPQRSTIVLNQLKAISQFASMLGVLPPSFYINGTGNRGGTVANGSSLSLTDTNSSTTGDVIYYTLDGSDPRLPGGAVSTSAHIYVGSFPIRSTETVTVRILKGATWSAIDASTYSLTYAASASNLAITELNYDPSAPPLSAADQNKEDYEFIELVNYSNQPINLAGVAFTAGIKFTFGNVILSPGQMGVLVHNTAAFQSRYGTSINIIGDYNSTGESFSNSGETVTLVDASGNGIASFLYGTTNWFASPHGGGGTMDVINPINPGNLSSPSSWAVDPLTNGSPGAISLPTISTTEYLKYDPVNLAVDLYANTTGTGAPAMVVQTAALNAESFAATFDGSLTVDFSAGNPVTASGGFNLTGPSSVSLRVIGNGGGDLLTVAATSAVFNTASGVSSVINYVNTPAITFTGGSGANLLVQQSAITGLSLSNPASNDTINVVTGTFTFPTPAAGSGPNSVSLGGLNVSYGGTVKLPITASESDHAVYIIGSVTVGGTVNLGNTDLDLTGADPNAITSLTVAGYNLSNGGTWSGAGITSTVAAGDSTHLSAVGVIQNNQNGTPIYTAANPFRGTTPGAGDVLAKLTYTGDANLDGRIDGSDYSLIDAGYAAHGSLTGWLNGDFNYDGVIDGSDYTLIDNAFNNQRTAFPTAQPAALAATAVAGIAAAASPADAGFDPATSTKSRAAALFSFLPTFAAPIPPANTFPAPFTTATAADLLDLLKHRHPK